MLAGIQKCQGEHSEEEEKRHVVTTNPPSHGCCLVGASLFQLFAFSSWEYDAEWGPLTHRTTIMST